MTGEQLKEKAGKLGGSLWDFLEDAGFAEWGELQTDETEEDAESVMLENRLSRLCRYLSDAVAIIDRMQGEVIASGELRKNERGRYEIPEKEFTCGAVFEYLAQDDFHACPYWRDTSLEAKNEEYYITDRPETKLDGLRVRIRRTKERG